MVSLSDPNATPHSPTPQLTDSNIVHKSDRSAACLRSANCCCLCVLSIEYVPNKSPSSSPFVSGRETKSFRTVLHWHMMVLAKGDEQL